MTTSAIRAKLAARGVATEPPYGCSWCGDERHHHGSQWAPIIGLHQWIEPDHALILERMRRRRAARKPHTSPPPLPPWEETVEEAARADDQYWDRDTDDEPEE
ncbi:hypothetical protein [Streptomyces sp. NBC_01716]|uniref:hypothetical protein n=1 Tax=Streptomyces sp. NBC_01716 TaxID=2975917 RepID=UPI002E38158C|nr:hypothetical protein [Streptomyces sp. NBC_01716]